MEKLNITTIIQIYKRPNYLQEQIEAVKNQTVKSDKIVIVHNEGEIKFKYPKDIQLVYANPNLKFHLRYAVGLLMNTEYISMLDDDTIPQPRWYENCIETIKKHNCICVTNGRIVDRKNKTQYGPGWSNPSNNERLVDFGGHALFFKKSTLKYMWYDEIIEYNTGEDIQLSANAQIYGNIPTYVPPHPRENKNLWGADPEKSMKYGCDEMSSWIVNKETHNSERFKLFDEYVKKGWKLVLEK